MTAPLPPEMLRRCVAVVVARTDMPTTAPELVCAVLAEAGVAEMIEALRDFIQAEEDGLEDDDLDRLSRCASAALALAEKGRTP
jgi:hypothetical protein